MTAEEQALFLNWCALARDPMEYQHRHNSQQIWMDGYRAGQGTA